MQSGEAEAIKTLYKLYLDRVYNYVFHSINHNKELAEDITQDTFLGAIKSAGQLKGKHGIYTWLIDIAHHKIMDHYRSEKKERIRNNSLIENTQSEMHSEEHTGSSASMESVEKSIEINRALSVLSPDYRQVLLLKYVEEMDTKAIALIMHRSPKAINSMLTRARKILKGKLSGKM